MLVDGIVATEDMIGSVVVPPHERIERPMQHVEHSDRHCGEFTAHALFGIALMLDRPLADIDRLVTDALQIRDQTQRRCQKPQIVGDRLAQRKNPQDERVNLKLIAVDLGVECLDVSRDLGGSPDECIERQPDDSFTSSAHRK